MAVKTNFSSNGKEYYRITCDVGIDVNGKRFRKQLVGKNKKEADKKKQDYLNRSSMGLQDKTLWFSQSIY
ncbi:hypothetical protein B0P06_004212 [Clostridium saccharoperbutylacetonicum]|uniref:Integrase n=1 Tax=Clostridium saccharoperbutylacetonicum N1-4(HMT) TaxID=931276 RepID=M1LWB8_9CLOT|nr:hypothetical protein [Clostridium saccharoperbutylacetonicum]AGF57485.1 hypothetical protein Cspa_c37250 [Clostridium saccharoperbutylacetonicum N1-4(HMT)]NRT61747.1 hypothetical protein [Clostridium saccharoperbutylacetonicum]NSB25072.1 hypothetical protein [Clostridium saccharoperbutylacetonicum]NSB44441.1 hypothetical protein [Clostridium saccharoperbutylacetonicum]